MPQALVIGGSLGGLLAANLLHSIGWKVQVFERVGDDLASRGAGIGTHEELLEIMHRVGIKVDASIGVHPESRTCLDRAGNIQHTMPRPRILSSWGRLYRALKDAFPAQDYFFDKTLVSFTDDANGVTATFADGTRAHGDLIIGADGIRSTVRAQIMPEVQPQYAGYVAWRGLIPESSLRAELHREIFAHNIVCYPDGDAMTMYAVPGPDNDVRPGHRAYNWVWYHPVDPVKGLAALCTDATGHCHGTAIAPALIRPEVIADMRATAQKVIAPQCVEVINLTAQPFFQAIFDLESPRLMHKRAVLLGDAAFVARPHVGMGVTKAALDAESLADALQGTRDMDAALARYNECQHLFGTRVIARARHVGAHLGAQATKPPETWTENERHQDPVRMMNESGARLRDVPQLIEVVRANRALHSASGVGGSAILMRHSIPNHYAAMTPLPHRLTFAALAVLAAASALITLPAAAQKDGAYPSRVVTLINPFSPGASTDIVARLIAQKLTEAWGQTMVVENRPGASGTIGLAAVSRAPADGHMLGMMIITHATNAALQGNKGTIDLVRDFTPVIQVVSQPYSLVVNPSLPVRSVRELIALAKTRPGALTYGSSGVGSVLHLAGELLAVQTKVQLTHVPYKGAAPALSDVAGGHLAMLFTTRMSAQAMVAAGRVRALAITSAERIASAPDLPTVQESGVTGAFDVNGWYGISGPPGLPAAIVDRLNQDINRLLKLPEIRERLAAEGTLPAGGTPAQFGELVRSEMEKWRRIIRQAAIVPAPG